jgi:hypothetical protein
MHAYDKFDGPHGFSGRKAGVEKFDCGCMIRKGRLKDAFEIFPCDYHKGNLNTTSWPLSRIEEQIRKDSDGLRKRPFPKLELSTPE